MKAIMIIVLMFAAAISNAQSKKDNPPQSVTYAIVNGKVVETSSTTKIPKDDPLVYTSSTGVKFYQGAKGGIYYWKISKKTGKLYKSYVK